MKLNNWLQKTGVIVLILSAILFVIFSSIKDPGSGEYIWIEAENADYLIAPLYIEHNEEASGGKAVIFKGAHHNYSGIAKYTISVKKEGTYYFWGRCLWKDACANVFFIRHNHTDYHFGEDPVFGKWHWLKGPSLYFKQGVNEVFLVSDEEYSQIDEILLTMDSEYVPIDDKSREMYFLDFEDSLVNKLKIKNEDNWRIVNDSTSSICISVLPKKNKEIALLDKTNCGDNFIFQLTAKMIKPQSELLIIIDHINDNNYRFISINRNTVRYCHFFNNHDDLIFEKEGLFFNNEFRSITLAKTNEYLKLKIEGKTIFDLSTNTEMNGKAGIGVSKGNILLDNIAYYFPVSLTEEDSFHDKVDFLLHTDRPEKAIKPFEKIKEGNRTWWKLNGNWKKIEDDTQHINGSIDTATDPDIKKQAILLWGNDFWKDYSFSVATKVKDNSGFGICFYFQDSLNYYLFKCLQDKDGLHKRQIIKIEDGNEKILAYSKGAFLVDTWYNIGIRVSGDQFTASVNNQVALMATDHSFKEGRLGFWTNSLQGACFDDIKIEPSDNFSAINSIRNYTFYTARDGQIARSLCDWDSNSQKIIYIHQSSSARCYVSKGIFNDVILNNINTLPENFKMEVNTSYIPQDIDAFFEFTSQDDVTVVYKFIISKDKITLLKNGAVITSSNTQKYDREKIEIRRINNEWVIGFATPKSFNYKDKIETCTWSMSIGYSGIGKGQIFINRIFIEEQP